MLLKQTWVISGARRGVGKTYLAKHLCAILPSSIYAKCGHGSPKRGKSEHFFNTEKELEVFIEKRCRSYEYIVVEANADNKIQHEGIRIFLEARANATDIRTDVEDLRDKADICVGGVESRADWKKVLKGCLHDSELIDAVLDILAEQQRWLSSSILGIRSKIWFVNEEGRHVFGAGLAQLLVEVEHLGSLKAAAKRVKVPYPRVRRMIKGAEDQFGHQLVQQEAKSPGEEKLVLTPTGKQLLAVYLRLNERAAAYVDKEFNSTLTRELSKLEKAKSSSGKKAPRKTGRSKEFS